MNIYGNLQLVKLWGVIQKEYERQKKVTDIVNIPNWKNKFGKLETSFGIYPVNSFLLRYLFLNN